MLAGFFLMNETCAFFNFHLRVPIAMVAPLIREGPNARKSKSANQISVI